MTITTNSGREIQRVSRWIQIQYKDVTPRHKLYCYSDDGALLFFRWNNREYAVAQFLRMRASEIWEEADGIHCISAYDGENYYNPLRIEIHEHGDAVRLYMEV